MGEGQVVALEQLGRFDEVIRVLNRAKAAKSGDPDLTLARGIAELKSGKPPEARSTFKKYRKEIGKKPLPPIYYNYAVLAAAISGYLEEAISLGREGLRAYPAEAPILVNTGAVLDRKGDHEAAEQYFLRALSSGSEVPPQAHKNLGDQAYRRGDRPGAKTHYETAVKLDASLGDDVYLKLGRIALEEEDNELAVLLLSRAMELNPQNADARSHLENLQALP